MDNEFKWLVNPMNEEFVFQYNSIVYSVPAKSRKLMLAEVAEHGAKRSFMLSDPVFDEDGNVSDAGNDVIQRCHTEEADVVNPVGSQSPIVIEKSKDNSANAEELFMGLNKPKRGRPRRSDVGAETEQNA